MTTTRHFLNALKIKDRQLAPPNRGTWFQEIAFLQKYAGDIELEGQVASTQLSHSVPSFFQRPIQFYHALADKKNPLHDAVTSEWRGILAVFALAGWLNLELNLEPVRVEPVPNGAASRVGVTGNGDLHFKTILNEQLPTEHWRTWWMIKCDGELLGATSPWTAVYTAAEYTAPETIPWRDDSGLLIDPGKYFDTRGRQQSPELSILAAWVSAARQNKPNWQMPQGLGIQENIIDQALEAWEKDLANSGHSALRLNQYACPLGDGPLSGILRLPGAMDGADSDLFIRSAKLGKRKVLVLSENLAGEKRVYRGIFADQINVKALPKEGANLVAQSGRRIPYPYVVAERLFLPAKLVQLKVSNAAMERAAGLAVPLTPDFFHYFDHSELEDPNRLQITRTGAGYKVTLRIPVDRGTLEVERMYSDTDIIRLSKETPGFGIWPDFYDESWTKNFAAYAAVADSDGDDLRVRPVFSDVPDGTQPEQQAKIGVHQKDVRIWCCSRPCIGFALEYGDKNLNEVFQSGMVLLRRLIPPPPIAPGRSWDVGVDFGTSSTMVMVSVNEDSPQALEFQGRTVFLTSPEDPQRLTAIENNLYPRKDTTTTPPFRTLLYEAAATVFGPTTYTVRFSSKAADDITNKPIRNVKWARQTGQTGESPLMAYLAGLVRYIVFEAKCAGVEQLMFHWSYPLSLPKGAQTKMEDFWNSQVRAGSTFRDGIRVLVAPGISESEAVCRRMAGPLRVRAASLAIAVDVGGGSTDIALWSARALKDQFSFKLAGNDLFDPAYLGRDTMAKLVEVCSRQTLDQGALANILSSPEIYVNGALTEVKDRNGAPILDPHLHPVPVYIRGGMQEVPPWQQFRSMGYLFFTGLAYYLGAHTRTFDVDSDKIAIYIGGRGSAGLAWLASSPSRLREVLGDAFLLGLRSHIQDDTEFQIKYKYVNNAQIEFLGNAIEFDEQYPSLKTEVASGLLHTLKDVSLNTQPGVYIGEVGWHCSGSDKSEAAWEKKLDAEKMAKLGPPRDFASTHIGNFITWVRNDEKKFLENLNLDAENLKLLWPHPDDITNEIGKSADGDDHVLQPLFGYELKVLMQQYAKAAAKAAKGHSANA